MIKIVSRIIPRISRAFPGLDVKLKLADISDSPEEFIKKTLMSSLIVAGGLVFFLWMVLARLGNFGKFIFGSGPFVFLLLLFYFWRVPDAKIQKKQHDINSEIVFAGRFLIIELESGVPLYDAFKNLSKNYKIIGKYFAEIVTKIDLGTQMEDALNESVEFTPSPNFRKILWQIVNSQQTGADMSTALRSVVEQITKEQLIEVQEYGRKLNPMAMFYMIIAVILPSIGITMFVILATFMDLTLELSVLLIISFFLAFIQFMFYAMIKSSRPSVEL
ncbi:MAG: type II secretion system F family protein [Candidatus Woesearchaeota archaeon]